MFGSNLEIKINKILVIRVNILTSKKVLKGPLPAYKIIPGV
jgi:hypothetical protein